MISKLQKLLRELEEYLSSRPAIADIIVDKYEIDKIYNIGETLVGATGVGEAITVDVKIKGTFDTNWKYIWTTTIEDYCGISIKGGPITYL